MLSKRTSICPSQSSLYPALPAVPLVGWLHGTKHSLPFLGLFGFGHGVCNRIDCFPLSKPSPYHFPWAWRALWCYQPQILHYWGLVSINSVHTFVNSPLVKFYPIHQFEDSKFPLEPQQILAKSHQDDKGGFI
jgi:hypothetical protein